VLRAVQGPIELLADEESESAGDVRPKTVAASIWRELSEKIGAAFDGVTIQDLCQRGEALGINRGDGQPHMYFI
jgi:DNA-binding IscR family transcriptional regulator